ncbi:hypothetical protein [Mesorhizobium sp.]|uniref:hypothetical protein n=1 Tax=Mesorhizobium sp. TaxID=1871066 RepID=UPI00257F8586|nr:hypothetical protein [Mesorhizobium sp.]
MVGINRAQGENSLGKNDVPVDRLHPAGFEEILISVDIVSAQIGGRFCLRVLAQIREEPKTCI